MLRIREVLYASLPLVLTAWQLWLLQYETFQVRYEELAEAVRNPYWFSHRLIYDGISSNVGWYGLLHLIYSTIGFELFHGRVVKVLLYGVGMFALSRAARKHLSLGVSVILVLSVGLSPTYLYFNRIMTSHATDLSYAAVWLFLVLGLNWAGGGRDFLRAAGAWAIAMLGCMSMPSFVPYLPAMGVLFLLLLLRGRDRRSTRRSTGYFVSAAAGFAAPVVAARLYIRGPLFYDPAIGSGLFRGGGGGMDGSLNSIGKAAMVVIRDLFVTGESYYFDLQRVEFHSVIAIVALVATGLGIVLAYRNRPRQRPFIGIAILLLATGLIVPNLSPNYPGLRRATGALAAFYLLYAFAVAECFRSQTGSAWLRRGLAMSLLLLPMSHALAQYEAFREDRVRSRFATRYWFETDGPPLESLERWLAYSEREQSLPACNAAHSRRVRRCRYSEIFAAIDGYRMWNGATSIPIFVEDPKTGGRRALSAAAGKFQ